MRVARLVAITSYFLGVAAFFLALAIRVGIVVPFSSPSGVLLLSLVCFVLSIATAQTVASLNVGDRNFALGILSALGLCGLGLLVPPRPGAIERVDPSDRSQRFYSGALIREHIRRYEFAKEYSKKHNIKSVADIASGTCYGMKILKEVVPAVDGYDKVRLCDNYVIDLDKESWSKQYDAIVSFETIEHLDNPDFFLANAARSAPVLIISTTVNWPPEQSSPFHRQFWLTAEFTRLLERYFTCEYFHQSGESFEPGTGSGHDILGVCSRRTPTLQPSGTP